MTSDRPPVFLEHRRNVHSQFGEDGILEWILGQLDLSNGFFVEFGAWDGLYLSNCRRLYEQGWSGCFIEGDARRFRDLERTYAGSDRAVLVHAFVSPEGETRLDALLRRKEIERVDLLSIDIDSDDLAIWKSVREYRAKCIVIEYNPTIPFDTRFQNPQGRNVGNSALSIVEHAHEIGYDLVAGTYTNLVFVDSSARPESVPAVTLQQIKDYAEGAFRYFFAYDGTLMRESFNTIRETELFRIPWSGAVGIQPLPRILRRFDRLNGVKKVLNGLVAIVLRPVGSVRMLLSSRGDRREPMS